MLLYTRLSSSAVLTTLLCAIGDSCSYRRLLFKASPMRRIRCMFHEEGVLLMSNYVLLASQSPYTCYLFPSTCSIRLPPTPCFKCKCLELHGTSCLRGAAIITARKTFGLIYLQNTNKHTGTTQTRTNRPSFLRHDDRCTALPVWHPSCAITSRGHSCRREAIFPSGKWNLTQVEPSIP